MSSASATEITLTGLDPVVVDGSIEQVEKALSDAARSGQSRLAWFKERGTGEPVALNPAHVIILRPSAPAGEQDSDAGRP